jgi:hypothetical protein
MTRFQRLRWAALGIVVGVAIMVAAFVVATVVVTSDPSDVDAMDAAKLAENWAADHRRPGEKYRGRDCEAEAGVTPDTFACWVRFEPSGRSFTLYMRTVVHDEDYEIALSEARPGIHSIPDIP